MVLHTYGPDEYVTCPFEAAHRILKSRMQFHLVRCFKNHPNQDKMRCPWNSLHLIDRCAYLDHCNNTCPDLANVIGNTILQESEPHREISSIPVNATNALLPLDGEENWDADPTPVGTYDPLKMTLNLPTLRSSIGLSKAKKKQFILAERKRHQLLDNTLPIQIPDVKPKQKSLQPPRPPHKLQVALSETSATNVTLDEDNDVHNSTRNSEYSADKSLPGTSRANNSQTLFDAQFDDCENWTEYGRRVPDKSRTGAIPKKAMGGNPALAAKSFASIAKSSNNMKPRIESPKTGTDAVNELGVKLAGLKTSEEAVPQVKNRFMLKNSKCAANFPQLQKTENPEPVVRLGRGIFIDYESCKNRRPGKQAVTVESAENSSISVKD